MTKEDRAKAACINCRAGRPASIWLDEYVHRWVTKNGQGVNQFSMTVCDADAIWKEPDAEP